MKALKCSITRGIPTSTQLKVADNSGAKIVEMAALIGGKTTRKRRHCAAIGDIIVAVVKDGTPDMKAKMVNAVIIRQKMAYRRMDGTRIMFEDNACVIVKTLDGEPKGTVIKGPVAREAVDRFSKIGKISSMVV